MESAEDILTVSIPVDQQLYLQFEPKIGFSM
jgi:hypothetical protein